jgi:hypothetical protein
MMVAKVRGAGSEQTKIPQRLNHKKLNKVKESEQDYA